MTAEVSSLVKIMNVDRDTLNELFSENKFTTLITRNLFDGSCSLDSNKLDLDLHVFSGWKKRLDLKRCNSSNSSLDQKQQDYQTVGKTQDLNFPPASKQLLNLFDEPNLVLNLSSSSSSSSYHSVCTLEKVKSALERAEKETNRKRSMSSSSSSSSPISNSEIDQENLCTSLAAGCPSCLLYVLISKNDPKCPRCHTIVPLPVAMKKPRIDLNISI